MDEFKVNLPATLDQRHRLLNEALNAIAIAITAESELDKIFQVIVDAARMLVNAKAAIIYHVNDQLTGLVSAAFSYQNEGDRRDPGHGSFMIPLGKGLISDIFYAGKPVRLEDVSLYPGRQGFPADHHHIKQLIGIPLADKTGKSIGLLMASDKLDGSNFGVEDEEIFLSLARQGGIAVENARLYKALRETNENLEALVHARTAELAQKNDELEEANRLKSEFLAKMSHELRTPLNSIIGFSDMLLKQFYGEVNDQQRDGLERVLRNGKHLLDLINDVLDIAKIEAARMPVRVEPFAPREVLIHAMTAVEPLARKKGLVLHADLDEAPSEVSSDVTKVRQIVLNLLTNAIKFSEAGEVHVAARKTPDHWSVSVRDTGIGLEADEIPKVFEEFYQVDSSTTRKAGGTGLGLPICFKTARLLGGTLSVESTPDVGSTFTVTLPLVTAPVEAV
ncbi:GAF domain-containing protein [bacterium]|nr:GAF domain-containing protein [bacterium]